MAGFHRSRTLILGISQTMACAEQSSTNLTALVNGRQVTARIPTTGVDLGTAQRLLTGSISASIVESLVEEAGIEVSPEKMRECVDAYIARGGWTSETASQVSSKLLQIHAALTLVVEQGKSADAVYRETLVEVINPTEWVVWVENYDSIEKLKQMESLIPSSLDDMKRQTEPSLRRDLEVWLLFENVTRDVNATDQEINEMYGRIFPSGAMPFLNVQESVRKLAGLNARMRFFEKWWKGKVEAQSIELPPGYEKCLESLQAPILPQLPESVLDLLAQP